MVVVVPNPILETSRRPGGLNTPDEAFGDQNAERVIHRLKRDGTDLGPDGLRDSVSRDVRLSRYRAQHAQSLGGNLNTGLTEEVCWIGGQAPTV